MSRPLPDRLRERWLKGGWTEPGDRVLLALSGGIDSLVLLHLLRFHLAELGLEVEGAHFDHRMREGSEGDARWVQGLAHAWGVPLRIGVAESPPAGEAEARRLRYDFLLGGLEEMGGRWVLTAHHADDQIETILFRILRGTGVDGLRGIPTARAPGVLRPLLTFSRAAIEAYAAGAGIRPRPDPTNLLLHPARNRLRREGIPGLEAVHPGAKRGILRLGRNAGHAAAALRTLLAPLVEGVIVQRKADEILVDRERLLGYPPEVRRALLRALARESGHRLSEAGTAAALEFISTGASGRRVILPGGLRVGREFDQLRMGAGAESEPVPPPALGIPVPDSGFALWDPEGVAVPVRWGWSAVPGRSARFDAAELSFPLEVRGWRPGDRIATVGGTRKVKELLRELRVPVKDRRSTPLLVDEAGRVLWVPGGARSTHARPGNHTETWYIGVGDDGEY